MGYIATIFGARNPYESNNLVIALRKGIPDGVFKPFGKVNITTDGKFAFVLGLPSGVNSEGLDPKGWLCLTNGDKTKLFKKFVKGKIEITKNDVPYNPWESDIWAKVIEKWAVKR